MLGWIQAAMQQNTILTFRSLHSWKKAKDLTYLLLDLSGFEDETLR